MTENYKPRNLAKVAGKIKDIIIDNYNSKFKEDIINEIDRIIYDSGYKAPELMYMCWDSLAYVLNANFNPDNSDWEKEIRDIFSGKIEV